MALAPGTRLGAYEIVGAVGAGGMGEVYRARDARLQRDVAIKVLPELFARDPERLARFEREARTLAAVNHPNIAHVYGVESDALVMEFVDGEDLSQRLARSGRIPVEDALPMALQIAEAIEAAHELGIIHRDLKPANIKIRADGQVKVLDFGLAKALAPADSSQPAGRDNSPTITSPFQLSQLGVILGTAAYMAPEQAKGKPVDKRADIWAFGCVLYEMLTGTRAFDGEDATETLAAIVRADPDWSRLPADTPPAVRTLLRRCLEKDRRERLPDIGAARLELKEAMRGGSPVPVHTRPPASRAILPWVVAALGALAALLTAIGAVVHDARRPPPDTRVVRTVIEPPSPLTGAPALRLNLSPDGRRLAFVAPDETGRTLLWIRPLDSMNAQPLNGTVNALSPFWSPDSRWVAFLADGKLKKIELSSGTILTVCDAASAPPGSWSREDVIIFTGAGATTLSKVSASGGTPETVTNLGVSERMHITPFFLPDGRSFLYTASSISSQRGGVFVGSLDSPKITRVIDWSTNAMYANGYLLFLREGTLLAQPFDPDTRKLSGAPATVAESVQINPTAGTGAFSVSQSGVLVFQTGVYLGTQLVWFDRSGHRLGTLGDAKAYRDVQLSPDGRFASVTVSSLSQSSVWVFDVARNLGRPFTFGDEYALAAVWTPDGQSLVYGARRGGGVDLYRRPSTGGGSEELLFHDEYDKLPLGFTPDSRTLLYRVPRGSAAGELWLLPLDGDRKARAFAPGNTSQVPAQVSPDGKWLAYVSDESRRRDVYVTSFPDGKGKWLVSTDGGDNPIWSDDGKELFFSANNRLVKVDVNSTANQFEAGPVQPLFPAIVPVAQVGARSTYTVSRDRKKFLVNTWDPRNALTPIGVVMNWPEALKR